MIISGFGLWALGFRLWAFGWGFAWAVKSRPQRKAESLKPKA
jgi:hypothetical protein